MRVVKVDDLMNRGDQGTWVRRSKKRAALALNREDRPPLLDVSFTCGRSAAENPCMPSKREVAISNDAPADVFTMQTWSTRCCNLC